MKKYWAMRLIGMMLLLAGIVEIAVGGLCCWVPIVTVMSGMVLTVWAAAGLKEEG